MTRFFVSLSVALGLVASTTLGVAGSSGPFEALGLVRLESGIKAPDFTLRDLTGHPVSLSTPSGSAALLVFWTTW